MNGWRWPMLKPVSRLLKNAVVQQPVRDAGKCRHFRWWQAMENEGSRKSHFRRPGSKKSRDGFFQPPLGVVSGVLLGLLGLAGVVQAAEPAAPDAELLEFLAELPEDNDDTLLEIALDEIEAESRPTAAGPVATVEETTHD